MKKKLRVALVGFAALSAGWAYMVSDEERFARLEKGADAIFDRILPA
ncbi:MAG TPA: hypothetical protein VFB39_01215 [Solirubrobacteraceae bacterium]|jgi:hypothetical protein|nr:hypothetical protein [Solirubrobacteraceae bacterium]